MRIVRLACVLMVLISCNTISDKNTERYSFEYSNFLIDSTTILKDVDSIHIQGELLGNKARIKYYSISENDFLSALKRNDDKIRLFNKKYKINENLSFKNCARKDSVLRIGTSSFIDTKGNQYQRASFFYLEDKVGKYFLVKKIQFEDAGTIFWDLGLGKEVFYLQGLSTCSSSNDSLIFYSSPSRGYPISSAPICLLKANDDKVDTVLCVKEEWYPRFAFFDSKDSSIYYIHNFFEKNELRSTYAKMDYMIY